MDVYFKPLLAGTYLMALTDEHLPETQLFCEPTTIILEQANDSGDLTNSNVVEFEVSRDMQIHNGKLRIISFDPVTLEPISFNFVHLANPLTTTIESGVAILFYPGDIAIPHDIPTIAYKESTSN